GQFEVKDGATKKYYSIAGMMVAVNDGTGLQYLLTDHLGSTVAATDSSGTLTSQQRYLPFGEERAIPNSPILATDFGYTGQRMLDSGMGGIMDYKARFYSPVLGRFIQPDSIIPNPANPQAFNRYSYVLGNPLKYTDPSGHSISCEVDEDCKEVRRTDKLSAGEAIREALAKFKVKLKGNGWDDNHSMAVLLGVLAVGNKLAGMTDTNESVSAAFGKVFRNGVNFTWGGEGATGMCASVPSGGCTSSDSQINFWSMSNDMVKNVVHELGHAFYKAAGNPLLGNAFSRDALIRNASYDGGEALVWEQHPISHNKDGKDITTELFADTFIAWTYDTWNPLNVDAVNSARNEMDRIAGSIP
ncbi:MAG: RHS repeat-associated core domain-containing protein, partial [Anaerolineales bacterium]|nr:RHS repeat-associated core domain-containing protein [Anaerolineales bacterium]